MSVVPWVTEKQSDISVECLQMIFVFVISNTLDYKVFFVIESLECSWQSTCDLIEYNYLILVCLNKKIIKE